MNAAWKTAFSEAMRISAMSASDIPPPAAAPSTAAMIGRGYYGMRRPAGDVLLHSQAELGATFPFCRPFGCSVSAQVQPCAEGPTLAGEDDRAGCGVVSDLVEDPVQCLDEVDVHRVELVRAVEPDQENSRPRTFGQDRCFIGHVTLPDVTDSTHAG